MKKSVDTVSDPDRVCHECGLVMEDDMPRAVVIDKGEVYIICLSCAEADNEGVKLGTPKHPVHFPEADIE